MSESVASSLRVVARHIVERDAHASWSVRRCAYYVITRLRYRHGRDWRKSGRAGYWCMARDERRAVWQGAHDGRREHINLYQFIMKGV